MSVFYILISAIIITIYATKGCRKLFKRRQIRVISPAPRIRITPLIIFLAFVTASILFSFSAFFFWIIILKNLPHPSELATRNLDTSTKIYDRHGKLLYQLYKDKNRTLISLSEVPMHVRLATIAAEDANFYNHSGISVKGITRATIKFIKDKKVTGGSTITQQLVKNALLTPDKTIIRKIREVLIAVAVEAHYSKDEILEMYLNEIPYGGTAYGIKEAAHYYFDKDIVDLSLGEAALLAGLPKSPTTLSPFGNNKHAAIRRQFEVLDLMKESGFISDNQAAAAKNSPLHFSAEKTHIDAPHFVMFIREQLAQMYGEDAIYQNGLNVYTTLDLDIQNKAQAIVAAEIEKLQRLNVGNGAALVATPQTGEILAMVGSSNYFNVEKEGNVNVVLRPRQPGSTIKVVNYAYALSTKYTPATVIDDTPTIFKIKGQPDYVPKNYDNKYRGRITLRSALAESRNIPAVKVLNDIGVSNMIELGKQMGINSWHNPNSYGLSLTLGGGEMTLYELAQVYSTLANYGTKAEFYGIEKIVNAQGHTVYTHKPVKKEVLDPRVSFIITDILRDNIARAPAFGSRSALFIPSHPEVAVKTGTSNDLRDNLTVGYNQDHLVAVWVGNNDNSPMSRIASGITGASPIWNQIITSLIADKPPHNWDSPIGLVQKNSCGKTEWFLAERSSSPCFIAYPGFQNHERFVQAVE